MEMKIIELSVMGHKLEIKKVSQKSFETIRDVFRQLHTHPCDDTMIAAISTVQLWLQICLKSYVLPNGEAFPLEFGDGGRVTPETVRAILDTSNPEFLSRLLLAMFEVAHNPNAFEALDVDGSPLKDVVIKNSSDGVH